MADTGMSFGTGISTSMPLTEYRWSIALPEHATHDPVLLRDLIRREIRHDIITTCNRHRVPIIPNWILIMLDPPFVPGPEQITVTYCRNPSFAMTLCDDYDWTAPQGAMVLHHELGLSYDVCEYIDSFCGTLKNLRIMCAYRWYVDDEGDDVKAIIVRGAISLRCSLEWLIGGVLHRDFDRPASVKLFPPSVMSDKLGMSHLKTWHMHGSIGRHGGYPSTVMHRHKKTKVDYRHRGEPAVAITASLNADNRITEYTVTLGGFDMISYRTKHCVIDAAHPSPVPVKEGICPTLEEFAPFAEQFTMCNSECNGRHHAINKSIIDALVWKRSRAADESTSSGKRIRTEGCPDDE